MASNAHVPGRKSRHESCEFGTRPRLVIETGHPIAPRVEIWQCEICHHGVTRPAMADVAPLYENRASDDYLARDGKAVRALKMVVFRRLARSLLAHASGPVRKVADFGTGSGMIANALAEESRSGTSVYAFDFFDEPPSDLGSVEYRSYSTSSELRGQIDLLTCFHVLEHSDDPASLLKVVRSYLRPGGTLIVEVPNVDCVWTPWFGKASSNWYLPYHRVHFSRQSLARLIESHGLEIVEQEDVCGPTFAASLAAVLGVRPNSLLFMVGAGLRPIQWLAEKLSGKPSALRVIARDSDK